MSPSPPGNTAAAQHHKDNNALPVEGGMKAGACYTLVVLDSSVSTPAWIFINLRLWFYELAVTETPRLATANRTPAEIWESAAGNILPKGSLAVH